MTTVCLRAKNPVKTEGWSSVFNSFSTDTESCLFIKQLTNTCVSTILYLRKILSDDFFEAKSFEGMTLKLLKSRPSDNNYIFEIHQWLEGAFDAIEKKYLKRLMLDIKDAESSEILEVYTMTFSYCNEKDSFNCMASAIASDKTRISVSHTKLNTIKLLQMCYAVTQTYRSLPSRVTLGMRLSYHENTPDDYQPRGYMAWEHNDPDFSNQARSVEIGVTGTPHHFFKLFNKSCLSDTFFKNMEEQLGKSGSAPTVHVWKKEKLSQDKKPNIREPHNPNADRSLNALLPVASNSETGPLFLVTEKTPGTSRTGKTKPLQRVAKDVNDLKVRCSCLFSKDSKSTILCLSCGFLVHSECFGIMEFDSSKRIRFYCHLCHQKENNRKCPDKVLISLNSSSDQQKLSLLRRILAHCNKSLIEKITLRKMEKLVGADPQSTVMKVVLTKMIEIGVAMPQGKKKNNLINRNELANQLTKYFYKIQDSVQTKPQVLSSSLRSSDSLKRKTENEELLGNKKTKTQQAVLQEIHVPSNQYGSQNSHDIFSL